MSVVVESVAFSEPRMAVVIESLAISINHIRVVQLKVHYLYHAAATWVLMAYSVQEISPEVAVFKLSLQHLHVEFFCFRCSHSLLTDGHQNFVGVAMNNNYEGNDDHKQSPPHFGG